MLSLDQSAAADDQPQPAVCCLVDWPVNRAHACAAEYLLAQELMSATAVLFARRPAHSGGGDGDSSSSFWCIYPFSEERLVRACAAAAGLCCRRRVAVRFQEGHAVKRVVHEWGLLPTGHDNDGAEPLGGQCEWMGGEELVIRHARGGGFTPEFVALASECYSVDLTSHASGAPEAATNTEHHS
jgi:hypothetical protein